VSTLASIVLLTAACGALSALIAGGFMLLPAGNRDALDKLTFLSTTGRF
jgi:hypothetical protein